MEKLVLTNQRTVAIRENLIEGLTIASGAKSSATYYHNNDEQIAAIRNNVVKLYELSKELPLIIANQKGVTGKFISEALLNEFKKTTKGGACNIVNPLDWYDNGIGDKAILNALHNLNEDSGITYVLRLFMELKKSKVNNERVRKIILGFLLGHPNIEFYSLKYRNKIAEVLKHVYGIRKTSILLSIAKKQIINNSLYETENEYNLANELYLKYFNGDNEKAYSLLLFIFRKTNGISFNEDKFPILSEYDKAKVDVTSVTKIPEEILVGLISDKKHPQHNELWSSDILKESTKAVFRKNVKVTSINQQVRQTKSTSKLGVEKNVNLEKVTDFLALYKTGYENGFNDELKSAIDNLAERKKINNFHYRNIGVVVDNSNSMRGHRDESKNTPKAIVNFTAKVLEKSVDYITVIKTEGLATDLASSLVELLKSENPDNKYDAIFLLTDGYENVYDGLTDEVLSVFKKETGREFPIFQISPITGAEMGGSVRTLGNNVVNMAINNPTALQPQINARLLEIDTKRWLENQVLSLEGLNITRKRKNLVNV